MIQTKSEQHVIFNITSPEFLPGKTLPDEFCTEANENGCWFFQPSHWTEENWFGGDALSHLRGYPALYSPGHFTEEAALIAAEAWEAGADARRRQEVINWANILC